MIAYRRIIYHFADGASYCEPIDHDDYPDLGDEPKDGDWSQPFPNTRIDSTAFGLGETFAQSDIGTMLIDRHGQVVRIQVQSAVTPDRFP